MSRVRWVNRLIAHSVVVHTREGASMKGVLTGAYRDCLVVAHAAYLAGDGEVKVDGEVVIPREQVAWLQVMPAEGMQP